MIPISRLLRDYRHAKGVAEELLLWGFVDECTFLSRNGAIGVLLRARGTDYECLDHVQRRQVAHRFEVATRSLPDNIRIYQYLFKRHATTIPAAPHAHPIVNQAIQRRRAYLEAKQHELYHFDIYLALVYEDWCPRLTSSLQLQRFWTHPRRALSTWFSSAAAATLLERDLADAVTHLRERTTLFIEQLGETLAPSLLPKAEAFSVLRRLVNYSPSKANAVGLHEDGHLGYHLAGSEPTWHGGHMELDDYHVKVFSLKTWPNKTYANMLEGLYTLPSEFIACSEWRRRSNASARRGIRDRQRHHHNRKVSLTNYLDSRTQPDEMLVDASAAATVDELGRALTTMEVDAHFFGDFGFTLVLFDEDPTRLRNSQAAAVKFFGDHDAELYEERYNLMNAWWSVIPTHSDCNVRRKPILETNYSDLSFLFTLDTGQLRSPHLNHEYLAAFETSHQTPYFWNLHYQDIGHALILGMTGAGKSVVMKFIVMGAQKYDPLTVIFDVGGGYKKLAHLLKGAYVPIGIARTDCVINPFCLDPTPDNLHFLAAWVRVLVQSGGQYHTTMQDDRAINEAVEAVYHIDRSLRRLCTVANLLPRGLSQHLTRWIGTGPYAPVFDNVDDTLTFATFQAFDFERMGDYPLVLEALLFYVLHRADQWIHQPDASGRLKLFVIDEAWRFVLDDTIRRYIVQGLKTWRKKNASVLLATQSTEDFAQSALLRTVVESCATKLFLANPGMDVDAYQRLFRLNQTEAQIVANLVPRQQILLKRPDISKVLNLHLDPQSYWLYTHTPLDDQRVDAVLAEHGIEAGLELLARSD